MALGDLDENMSDNKGPEGFWPPHEKDKMLQEMLDDLQDEFPEEIRCDFIEVSRGMERCSAKAYYREGGKSIYIRFADWYVESRDEEKIRKTMLHEMVHLYIYQKGYSSISDGSDMFKWICGQVGAGINQVSRDTPRWNDLAKPFLEEK